MAEIRKLIVLRPCLYNGNDLRLGLFAEDYQELVRQQHIDFLYVNFGDAYHRIGSLPTYLNHGSIAKKSIINTWLRQKGFTEREHLLLFELVIDDRVFSHTYRFIGSASEVTGLIDAAYVRIR